MLSFSPNARSDSVVAKSSKIGTDVHEGLNYLGVKLAAATAHDFFTGFFRAHGPAIWAG